MKKLCITFCVLLIIISAAVIAPRMQPYSGQSEYLRIHVRANSNSQTDQSIKYAVKDSVVQFVAPYVANCTTKSAAIEVMGGLTEDIERVCDARLAELGADYAARAQIRRESFPTRVYDGRTLPAGEYDALIIELGEGTGDNWWCVIYPPLCFTSVSANVHYRSIIYDIIDKFFNSHGE